MTVERSAPPPSSDRTRVEGLVRDNLALADGLARRYVGPAAEIDDLRQVARLGLTLAAGRFDPEAGEFVRYATVTIIGELKKYLRSTAWAVHVPRGLQEDALTVANAIDRLTVELGRSPITAEVAERTGLTSEAVVEALRVRTSRYRAVDEFGVDVEPASIDDIASSVELRLALGKLDEESRQIVEMCFDDGLHQSEIGEQLGMSQPSVHRRLHRALGQLRNWLDEE